MLISYEVVKVWWMCLWQKTLGNVFINTVLCYKKSYLPTAIVYWLKLLYYIAQIRSIAFVSLHCYFWVSTVTIINEYFCSHNTKLGVLQQKTIRKKNFKQEINCIIDILERLCQWYNPWLRYRVWESVQIVGMKI